MVMSASSSGPATAGSFAVRQVATLLGLSERQLRYWAQTGFIVPSAELAGRVAYTFRDLVSLKVAKALLDQGVPLRRVRRSLAALARDLPEGEANLASLRIRCEGDAVIVGQRGRSFEPATGQLVLDFEVASLEREAAAVLHLPWVDGAGERDPETAYDFFLQACELEQEWGGSPADTQGFEAAREAYERAVALDPSLAAAWTNLGSMLAEVGDVEAAREHFRRAVEVDPGLPEAHCNLAELYLREGKIELALASYRHVVELTPDWAEGHYGLARALLQAGRRELALAHLERFRQTAQDGTARQDEELSGRLQRANAVIDQLRRELRD